MKSAQHNLSHTVKLSCNQGEIVPIGLVEALPGDSFNHSTAVLLRTQPLVSPVMHEVDVKIHHWYVPTRIIWDDFQNFITGGQDGLDATVAPTITMPGAGGAAVGSLADYLGVPTGINSLVVSALPFRAYQFIWNEFYRDKDLQPAAVFSKGSGNDTTTSTALRNACWEKDYFTSSRVTPQKGTAVSLPLTGNAPVVSNAANITVRGGTGAMTNLTSATGAAGSNVLASNATTAATAMNFGADGTTTTGLKADLSSVTAATINDLRIATALQRYKENMSRWGSNYRERILAAFGVNPQDGRFQVPEYLGGGSQKIQFSEVLQTAPGTDPVADMKGHGISAQRSNKYKFYSPEHGFIISVLIVRPRTQYFQGLNKMWSRSTKEAYFQPELQYLGQQNVLNKEVYAAHATPGGTFGYQDRYDEYRRVEDRVAGDFKTTLKDWHMAREFGTTPALNATFVEANPTNRIYAITTDDQLLITAKHNMLARRRVGRSAQPMLF